MHEFWQVYLYLRKKMLEEILNIPIKPEPAYKIYSTDTDTPKPNDVPVK